MYLFFTAPIFSLDVGAGRSGSRTLPGREAPLDDASGGRAAEPPAGCGVDLDILDTVTSEECGDILITGSDLQATHRRSKCSDS